MVIIHIYIYIWNCWNRRTVEFWFCYSVTMLHYAEQGRLYSVVYVRVIFFAGAASSSFSFTSFQHITFFRFVRSFCAYRKLLTHVLMCAEYVWMWFVCCDNITAAAVCWSGAASEFIETHIYSCVYTHLISTSSSPLPLPLL